MSKHHAMKMYRENGRQHEVDVWGQLQDPVPVEWEARWALEPA